MTAPVEGSGDWPAWMVRVAKPRRLLFFMIPLGPSGHAAAQMVQQIDAGDEPEELAALDDEGDMILLEDRQQIGQRPVDLDDLEAIVHGAGDRVAEMLGPAIDGQQ